MGPGRVRGQRHGGGPASGPGALQLLRAHGQAPAPPRLSPRSGLTAGSGHPPSGRERPRPCHGGPRRYSWSRVSHVPPRIGRYRLTARLGRGAMGEVWAARVVPSGEAVAVKLLGHDRWTRRSRRHLLCEVVAMARLDHRAVVRVLDFGNLVSDANAAPYLVTELVSGGSLREGVLPSSWPEARRILAEILEGLAHAHARGVLHRDLKPANVLMDDRGEPQPKIGDFGLARARGTRAFVSGATPAYAAPEQLEGRTLEEGPWTDLYAIGCLTHWLTSGHPPFSGPDLETLIRAHATREPPPLAAAFEVPAALEAWVRRLLEKRPGDRYELAADALAALPASLDAPGLAARVGAAPASAGQTESLGSPPRDDEAPTVFDADPIDGSAEQPTQVDAPPNPTPPADPVARPLWAMRILPLIGRDAEATRLWAALLEVKSSGCASARVVVGEAGVGKTRLLQWLAHRAHETGAARVLWGRGVPEDPLSGIRNGIRAGLDVEHLDGRALRRRLDERLRDHGSLAALLAAELDREESTGRTELDRFATLRAALRALAARRPILLIVDDIHREPESLRFLRALRVGPPAPVLGVAARRLESAPEELADDELRLGSLPQADHERLLAQVLGLEPSLARSVVERAVGRPAHSLALVASWMADGALVAEGTTLRLADRSGPPPPDAVHDVWMARVERALSGPYESSGGPAMELAAVIGHEVERGFFQRACDQALHLAVHESRLERSLIGLARAGIVEPTADGFRFAHALSQEALVHRAASLGRLRDHHLVCARELRGREGAGVAERMARHYAAAGVLEEATEPMLGAAAERLAASDFVGTAELLEERARWLDAMGVPSDDERRQEGRVLRAHAAATHGELEEAGRFVRAVGSDEALRPHLRAELELVRGVIGLKRGDPRAAVHYERALEGFRSLAISRPEREADCLHGWGHLLVWSGEVEGGAQAFAEAASIAESDADDARAGRSYAALADAQRRLGGLDEARRLSVRSMALLERSGRRHALYAALNTAAEIERTLARFDEARRLYRNALALAEELSLSDEFVALINLGLVEIAARSPVEARAWFRRAVDAIERNPSRASFRVFAIAGLSTCAAMQARWDEWIRWCAELQTLLEGPVPVEEDLEMLLAENVRLAERAGDPEHVRLARALRRRAPTERGASEGADS
ncbi:MAG TPA: protein kinase [Sandaracinaceae bacterium LLY-WYZ-13_1]|nr:protein kinase [Sandaracinaceae bacterium LLY-WYZ-13_1]